jgi:hypothetical protein
MARVLQKTIKEVPDLAQDANELSTASGSAPSYAARAWVNFNGTGTVAIRASGNVTSITDLGGTGVYAVNFTTSMQDANYSIAGCCRVENRSGVLSQVVVCYHRSTAPTSNSVTIETMVDGGGANPFSVDTVYVTLQVFR